MIEVTQLQKLYQRARGLDGFSLAVGKGELFGLVGPNGAGKSTLIKILATLICPDSGQARVAGFDVMRQPRDVKRILGYMPDQPGLYQDMRVREFLEFFADAFLVPRSRQRAVVELQLDRAGLAARSESFVEELSFGMKQRLFLAKTLLHEPAVLLLDEPATGLDPLARVDLRQQLKDLHATGITILISSHILSDLEDICSRVAFIAEGKNAADAAGSSVMEVQRTAAQLALYEVECLGDADAAARAAGAMGGVRVLEVRPSRFLAEIAGDDAAAADFLRQMVAQGTRVVSFAHPATQLEDRYRQVFGAKRP